MNFSCHIHHFNPFECASNRTLFLLASHGFPFFVNGQSFWPFIEKRIRLMQTNSQRCARVGNSRMIDLFMECCLDIPHEFFTDSILLMVKFHRKKALIDTGLVYAPIGCTFMTEAMRMMIGRAERCTIASGGQDFRWLLDNFSEHFTTLDVAKIIVSLDQDDALRLFLNKCPFHVLQPTLFMCHSEFAISCHIALLDCRLWICSEKRIIQNIIEQNDLEWFEMRELVEQVITLQKRNPADPLEFADQLVHGTGRYRHMFLEYTWDFIMYRYRQDRLSDRSQVLLLRFLQNCIKSGSIRIFSQTMWLKWAYSPLREIFPDFHTFKPDATQAASSPELV